MKQLVAWLRRLFEHTASPRPPGPIADFQIELTELALKVAKGFGKELDFSHNSIKVVEFILAELHQEYAKTRKEDGLRGIAVEFGAYIATTIQRNEREGVLERNHPEFGDASFPFTFSRGTIFPYIWCTKRIFDGEGDDVWFKYRALVLEQRGPNDAQPPVAADVPQAARR